MTANEKHERAPARTVTIITVLSWNSLYNDNGWNVCEVGLDGGRWG